MAKIDTTKIEGYAEMTAEQKLAVLEGYDLPAPDMTGFVKKDLLERANSEAANYKKALREKMSQDEQAAAQQAEALKAMQEELESLRQDKRVTELSKRYMGLGYGEELATATAKAMAEGDMDKVFKNQAQFAADREKALKADLLKQTPAPPAGAPATGVDYAKEIAAAQEKGDFAAAAYYTRLAGQQTAEMNK